MSLTHPSPWTLRRTFEALIMALLIALGGLIAPRESLSRDHATLASADGTGPASSHRPPAVLDPRIAGLVNRGGDPRIRAIVQFAPSGARSSWSRSGWSIASPGGGLSRSSWSALSRASMGG